MSAASLWFLGLTAHAWRNRRFLLFLVLVVPVVTAAAVKLMNGPEFTEGMVLK